MLSIIVPAYNEAGQIRATLHSLHEAARACNVPYELIVVDDASDDDTAALAARMNARVEHVHLRHIAATRNAGAALARYPHLVFVDADTRVPPPTLQAALHAMRSGAVGGGATVRFDGPVPLGPRLGLRVWNRLARLRRWAAGCFIFAQRDAFQQVGGFDEAYYAAEELRLSRDLRRHGRFVILREPVDTSARKFHQYRFTSYLKLLVLTILSAGRVLQARDRLPQWYSGERQ